MKILRGLVAAFSHFSILPVPHSDDAPDAYAIAWLPLVGLVIGAASGWAAYGTYLWIHSTLWSAITAFALTILLTGAIHLDGFLDSCDALLASTTVERRLEILKDPRHGTYAIVGMVLLCVVWLAALFEIPPAQMPLVLAVIGFLSRSVTLIQIGWYKHARSGSRPVIVASIGVLLFVVSGVAVKRFPILGLLLIIALVAASLYSFLASRRLGGALTGDVYGAIITLTEVSLLKAYALLPVLFR